MSTFVLLCQMDHEVEVDADVYVGPSVLRDLDIDGLAAAIPTFTKVGADALKERLSNPVNRDEIQEVLKGADTSIQ